MVAGVVIKQDGKYLLIQENRPNNSLVHGLWNFPAGKLDEGETLEEAAVREAKEEAGYDVELVRKLGVFQSSEKVPPQHSFEAKIIGGELVWPKNEILNAKWFTWDEIKQMKEKLRGEWVLSSIKIIENKK